MSARILVAEDEPIVAMDLERSLAGLGYEVAGIADSGSKAVRLAGESHPDLVLMDVQLRGKMDGIAAAEEIRRRWQIPVVYTTAYSTDEVIERAKATRPLGFLVKPFRTKELNAAIAVALNQHRLAQEVLASRAWLSTILVGIRDAVIATDAEGRVQFLNPSACELTGCGEAELIGKPIEEVCMTLDEEHRPIAECQVRRAMATGKPQPKTRMFLRRRDGDELPIEATAVPMIDARGAVTGAVKVCTEISDRLRLEMLQAAEWGRLENRVQSTEDALRALAARLMTAQEEERARVARELHDDFAQRLALLGIEAERLLQYAVLDDVRSGLERIGVRAAELSDNMRTLSHRLHPAVVEDLGLVLALRALAVEWRSEGIEVSFGHRAVVEPVPLPTATCLYRIAQEALRNAGKHAPDAAVRVQLAQESGELKLVIEDTGPGFDVSEAKERGGLGLLSMKERARLAGGTLEIETRSGDGTRVIVRLPRD
jgi:PAS domain S-box-containing protein